MDELKEEVATNAISGGHVDTFDPLLGAYKAQRKKKMSDVLRRWMQGR